MRHMNPTPCDVPPCIQALCALDQMVCMKLKVDSFGQLHVQLEDASLAAQLSQPCVFPGLLSFLWYDWQYGGRQLERVMDELLALAIGLRYRNTGQEGEKASTSTSADKKRSKAQEGADSGEESDDEAEAIRTAPEDGVSQASAAATASSAKDAGQAAPGDAAAAVEATAALVTAAGVQPAGLAVLNGSQVASLLLEHSLMGSSTADLAAAAAAANGAVPEDAGSLFAWLLQCLAQAEARMLQAADAASSAGLPSNISSSALPAAPFSLLQHLACSTAVDAALQELLLPYVDSLQQRLEQAEAEATGLQTRLAGGSAGDSPMQQQLRARLKAFCKQALKSAAASTAASAASDGSAAASASVAEAGLSPEVAGAVAAAACRHFGANSWEDFGLGPADQIMRACVRAMQTGDDGASGLAAADAESAGSTSRSSEGAADGQLPAQEPDVLLYAGALLALGVSADPDSLAHMAAAAAAAGGAQWQSSIGGLSLASAAVRYAPLAMPLSSVLPLVAADSRELRGEMHGVSKPACSCWEQPCII